MKKQLLLFVSLILAATINAQVRPQQIRGINVEPHDSAWYAEQARAWLAEAQRNPVDELAWKYYFMATSYMARESDNDSTSIDTAMSLLEQNIKDTYTYNYCKYRQMRDKADVSQDVADGYLRKAMEKIPEKKDFFDYDVLTFFCATHDSCPLLKTIAAEYYSSNEISQYALDYSRNELRGIPSNAIYIGTTDVDLIPKWVLRYGNDEFKGNYCIFRDALLFDNDYRKMVFANLGITEEYAPYTKFQSWEDYSEYTLGLFRFIVEKTGRQIYFSGFNQNEADPWYDNLWYEGLAYRYSEEGYDVDSVRQNNIEHVYDWQAAQRPVKDDNWENSNNLAARYIYTLHNALYFYAKKVNKAKARQYYKIAEKIVKGMTISEDAKDMTISECAMLFDCAKKGVDPDMLEEYEE